MNRVLRLVREILEETALVVKDIQFVLAQDCIHSPEFYRDAHFLLLNYTCRVSGSTEVHLNSEAQDFRWIQPQDTLALSLNQPTRILVEHILKKES